MNEGTTTLGGITVSKEIFKGLKLAEIESMAWGELKNIFVMGDHVRDLLRDWQRFAGAHDGLGNRTTPGRASKSNFARIPYGRPHRGHFASGGRALKSLDRARREA